MANEKKSDPMHGNLGNVQYSIHLIGKDCMQLSFETRSNDYKVAYVNPIAMRIEVHARGLSEIKDFANGVYKAVRILVSHSEKAEQISRAMYEAENKTDTRENSGSFLPAAKTKP